MARRVAVIGGGSSGLTCIKCCLDEGLEPVCFESSDDIGGLWRFKENPEQDRASIYQSVIINTSKEMMCFSDYPIPAHFPNYMHNSYIMEYFRMYAEHFKLQKYVRLKTKVLHVIPRPDFAHSGQWDIETEDSQGNRAKHVFDAVLVCTGHHCHPHIPVKDFPGLDTFKGTYFHSRDYKTPEDWRGKRAVVIGIGNSGGDIAVELSRMTKQVFLSTRRGSWILNRVGNEGVPMDMVFNRFSRMLQAITPNNIISSLGEKKLNQRFNHAMYGLQPKHRLLSQHPMVNDDLPNRIISGTVMVKPNVREFRGSSVVFEDGTVEDNIELVVFATGYTFSFPFLPNHVISVTENRTSLYKNVYPPGLEKSTLAVIGLVQPLGAIMPISEMQARWATRVFKGLLKLPSKKKMQKDIKAKEDLMAKRYVASQRHTIQVDYLPYMDELAVELGARPKLFWLFLTDPGLAWRVMFGPSTPYQYRLFGPGRWEGARKAIYTQWERVAKPLKTRSTPVQESHHSVLPLLLSVSAAAVFSAIYYTRSNLAAACPDLTSLLDRVTGYLPRLVSRQ
ncbi:dimethylaniline monooxygenase N-oxide-forming 5-like [Astyanax mexicanus]|uniref:Flavin-containing monooxygenase n=1 Tax=Astyanax mexicanus TaxID=7994 RepID=A0A8B9K697_ASTMX|nr:dimethylaniline monooxygenase N-oxide-forming 5-like [Astyanax mexicanus]